MQFAYKTPDPAAYSPAEKSMKLTLDHPSETTVVVSFPQSNLDASNVKSFRDVMQPIMAANNNVLLDMSALSFVDSSGLGALLSCLRSMNGKSGALRLFGLTRPVLALFELVRMHRIFLIYNSREDALQDVGAP